MYNRVQNKLTGWSLLFMEIGTNLTVLGRDFNPDVTLAVPAQVDKLIEQATALENLCQCFSGWCAFW